MFFKKKGGDKKQSQVSKGVSKSSARSFEDMVAALKEDSLFSQTQSPGTTDGVGASIGAIGAGGSPSPIGLEELERDKAMANEAPGIGTDGSLTGSDPRTVYNDPIAEFSVSAPVDGVTGIDVIEVTPHVESEVDSINRASDFNTSAQVDDAKPGDSTLTAYLEAVAGLPTFGTIDQGATQDAHASVSGISPASAIPAIPTSNGMDQFAFTGLTSMGESVDPSGSVGTDILAPGNVKQAPKSPADLLQGVIAGLPGFKKAKSETTDGFVAGLSSAELREFSKELSKVQGKTLLSQKLRPSPEEQRAWDQHSTELHANFPKNVSRSTQVIIAGDKVLHPDVCMHCKCKNKLGMWNKYGFPVYKAWLEAGALRDANNVHSFVLCDDCATEHFGSVSEISSAITIVWARVGMKKILRRLFADFDWMDPSRCDEEIKHLAGDCVMFVAYCRGVPVGFISFGIDVPTRNERKGIVTVEAMYVRPTFQGFGVGYLLMDAMFRFRDWIPVYHYRVKEGYPGMDKVRDWLLERYFDKTDAEGQYQFKSTIYEHNDYEPTV